MDANYSAVKLYRERHYIPRKRMAPCAREDIQSRLTAVKRMTGLRMTNLEIAKRLDICVRTVERYRARLVVGSAP